jgi:serine/threonine-protein kinase
LLRARQKLGKYTILGRLSSGPLADVYQAYDRIQKMKVALKIPRVDHLQGHEEFLHEVRVATRLKHPNLLGVLNASYIDDHFVIALELGVESLADRLERRISTANAMDLVGQALSGLAFMHENRVIHCDVKPENFILFAGNRLKLADYGFAKVRVRTLKASGSGTIDYIAPEQAMGRPKFQSDVFSVGLVIYQMLAGRLPEWPFEWPLPGQDRLEQRVRPEFVDFLRQAIQLDPKHRFNNASDMHAAFERLQSHARKQVPGRKKAGSRSPSSNHVRWQELRWREFSRRYGKVLEARYQCRHCDGPVAESMQACPWCGSDHPSRGAESRMPSSCPRCDRGVKNDWDYCSWCYGPGFVAETARRYPDKRYKGTCSNKRCKGPLMPFMRYCPWCRSKVRKPWRLEGGRDRCGACGWGIASEFWNYCAWCCEPVGERPQR